MEKDAQSARPKVGVGVMILNEKNEALFLLRAGSHGAGEWSFPGGHVEFGDTIFETAKKEVKEEVGLDVSRFELVSVFDEMRYIKSDGKHYVNIGVKAGYEGGEPQNLEPETCKDIRWFPLDAPPEKLFEPTEAIIKNYRDKVMYRPAR